jgi:hypothetical protein
MPLYEDLIRRALALREKAELAKQDTRRVRKFAQLLRDAEAGTVLLVHCAWCERLRLGEEWLRLSDVGSGPRIAESLIQKSSHGICPDCFQRVSEEVEAAAMRVRQADALPGGGRTQRTPHPNHAHPKRTGGQ